MFDAMAKIPAREMIKEDTGFLFFLGFKHKRS